MREEKETTSRREDDKCVDGWMDRWSGGWRMAGWMFLCVDREGERESAKVKPRHLL